MPKTLIIAEKPSVAADLARTLTNAPGMDKFKKEKDYFENGKLIISSAVGHLVELSLPNAGGKKLRWGFEHLPVIPEKFALQPIEKTKDRYRFLKKLMLSPEVGDIINACDAGREGELIFRYLMESVNCKKPVRRLWMQSMTANSILSAWGHLRDDKEMQPLSDAAKCRSESDWLVGINATRAMTAHESRHGGFNLTPVGRVQTPTLTILVQREKEIAAFISRPYFEIAADWQVKSGDYPSKWFQENPVKSDDPHARPDRIWDRKVAEKIVAACQGKDGVVEETTKPRRSAPPLLYDLTSLQREASNRFGFSARTTLSIAQALYEKHKALTYPRTDSRYLPGDYPAEVNRILKDLSSTGADTAKYAADILKRKAVQASNRRVFDDSKVSDHFAIIPTGERPGNLSEVEAKLYDFVLRRFLSVFYPAAEHLITQRVTRVDKDAFRTQGKILQTPGWLTVYGKEADTEESGDDLKALPPVRPGEKAANLSMDIEDKDTKPPPRYNEATLLSAMESAGKTVEDEELREAMSERGLGTPATRAAIIEGLIADKYIQRDGRNLVATAKSLRLIDEITDIGVAVLTAPQLTGEWEYRLKQMQSGGLDRADFMRDIRKLTEEIVAKTKHHSDELKSRPYPDLQAACPVCGTSPLKQTDAHYACPSPDCRFRLAKTVATRPLAEEEAVTLLTNRLLPTVDGFRNRFGKEFSAGLQFEEDMKVAFVFEDSPGLPSIDPAELNDPLCPCPICKENKRKGVIHVTADQYICSERAASRKTCPAQLPRELCRLPIPREQARKFFENGRTDVMDKFISKKGRPFAASLVLKPVGKKLIEWEFPPREKKAPGAKAPAKRAPAKKKS